MRRVMLGLAVVLGCSALSSPAHGQASTAVTSSGFSDPFFLYYSWYLPRQEALANQPGPQMMVNQQAAARRENAMMDREDLLAPPPLLGFDELDPLRPFGRQGGYRGVRAIPHTGITHQNLNGSGPPSYYNRVAGYHPGLRTGVGRNMNIATGRSAGRGRAASRVPNPMGGMAAGMMVPGRR